MQSTQSSSARPEIDELRRLRLLFEELERPKLFHATRVLIDPQHEEVDDLKEGWQEFLEQPTFGHSTMRLEFPGPRVQHFCFFGGQQQLSHFTGLAAQAVLQLPLGSMPRLSPNPKDWEPRYCRDQWLLVIYRIAYLSPGQIMVTRDLQRNGEQTFDQVDRGFFDPLALAANFDECEDYGFQVWRESFKNSDWPRYLYARLSLDVVTSSLAAIDHVVEHEEQFFGRSVTANIFNIDDIFPLRRSDSNSPYLGIALDEKNRIVSRAECLHKVKLGGKLFKLLRLLLRGQGATIAYSVLYSAWSKPLDESSVARLHGLRHRLKNKIRCLDLSIENDRSHGYRLVALKSKS